MVDQEVTIGIPQDSLPYAGSLSEAHLLALPRCRHDSYNSGRRRVKTQLDAFLTN